MNTFVRFMQPAEVAKNLGRHWIAPALFLILLFVPAAFGQTIIFQEDFESGQGDWFADNGVWEIGKPTAGPDSTHSPENCAGTILTGNYPPNANSNLISPRITLPSILTGERLQMYFWHWFRINEDDFSGTDKGRVYVSVNDGSWIPITNLFSGLSPLWTQVCVDLSEYAGERIRLAFGFTSTYRVEDRGWYVDDLSIVKKNEVKLANTEDFEKGIGDWYADNGLWEVGQPQGGVSEAHSGNNVAGVVLTGNYFPNANTRLISPPIHLETILPSEQLLMYFWHWFVINEDDFSGPDQAFVQISVQGGPWETIGGPFSGICSLWTRTAVNLSAFAGSVVRIAFYFVSTYRVEATGWYIDDLSIKKIPVLYAHNENFENGLKDWYCDNGLWQVGKPTVGPPTAFSGENCAAVVLNGNYFPNANSRFISPAFQLVPLSGQKPELFFWHWFRINEDDFSGPDQGYVQISVNGKPWQTIGGPYTGISERWTQTSLPSSVDLSAYADSTVRVAFYFVSTYRVEDRGWYIDDIRFNGVVSVHERKTKNHSATSFILHQNYPNPFNPETVILYELPQMSQVEVAIFNLLGERIRTLANQRQIAGQHRLHWDGRNEFGMSVPSGVYLYRLRAGDFVQTRKMVLMQ